MSEERLERIKRVWDVFRKTWTWVYILTILSALPLLKNIFNYMEKWIVKKNMSRLTVNVIQLNSCIICLLILHHSQDNQFFALDFFFCPCRGQRNNEKLFCLICIKNEFSMLEHKEGRLIAIRSPWQMTKAPQSTSAQLSDFDVRKCRPLLQRRH